MKSLLFQKKVVILFPNGNIDMERDREATEKRLLDTIGQMIVENGFEKIGINAVSARSGVSKILIYRYFNSIDGLIAAYIRKHDFWLNFSLEFSDATQVLPAVKKMFREHIEQLRTDPILRKLYRWELSCDNEVITALREQRETIGMNLIKQVCTVTGRPQQEIAALSAMITASITYLAMLGDYCPIFNGINIGEDNGWKQIYQEVENLIDRMFAD